MASNEVVTIDATTVTDYSGVPLITLDGTAAIASDPANGLALSGGSSTIKFDIINFRGNGIQARYQRRQYRAEMLYRHHDRKRRRRQRL